MIHKVKKENICVWPDGIELSIINAAPPDKSRAGYSLILIVLLGVFGIFLAFAGAFCLDYSKMPAFLCLTAYIALFSAVFFFVKRKGVFLLVIIAVWAAAGIIFGDKLYYGYQLLFSQCRSAVSQASGLEASAQPLLENYMLFSTAALCYAMLPVTLLLSQAVLFRFNIYLALLPALPVLEVCLYYGVMPELAAFALLIAFLLSVAAMQRSSGRPKNNKRSKFYDERGNNTIRKNSAGIGITAAFCVGFALIAFGLLVPDEAYSNYVNSSPLLSNINQMLDKNFWLELFGGKQTEIHGGITGGRLSDASEYTFSGETDLKVTADSLTSSIYLRGFVGADYNGDSWTSLDNSGEYEEMVAKAGAEPWKLYRRVIDINDALLSPAFKGSIKNISVENIAAPDEYTYAPYNAYYENGLKLAAGGEAELSGKKYDAQYYDLVNYKNNVFLSDREAIKAALLGSLGNGGGAVTAGDINDCFSAEVIYSDYVHKVYTTVPDDLPEQFVSDFGSLSYTSVESLIKYVTVKLSAMATYTLSPGAMPEGDDFVNYFLYENKKGYCTHFATAATLIFRMAGIPARYVEGYVVTVDDYTKAENNDGRYTMSIKDSSSHAWVELYLDGFGWVPVEVTPGFTTLVSDTSEVSGETAEFGASAGSSTNELNIENPVAGTKAASDTASENEATKAGNSSADLSRKTGTYIIIGLTLMFAVVAAVYIRRGLILRKRRKRFSGSDFNSAALAAYSYTVLIISFAGVERSDFISEIEFARESERAGIAPEGELAAAAEAAYKAALSGRCISNEEAQALIELANESAKRVYSNCSFAKKLMMRFFVAY